MRLNHWYLRRLKVFFLLAEIRGIIDRIAASPQTVPHPNPAIPAMEAAWAEAYDAAQKAKFGDRNYVRQRQQKFEILIQMMEQQMGTVASFCTETEAQALGFRVSYKKADKSFPIAPKGVKAEPTGINDSVKVSWRRSSCPGAYAFSLEITQENPLAEANWKPALASNFTSRGTMTIPYLKNLQKYWFRVQAHFPSGVSPYSDPVMSVVL